MQLKDIKRELSSAAGGAGMITKSQLLRYMGRSIHSRSSKTYLEGLEAVDGKYYFISDVAKRLYMRQQ